MNLEIKNLNTSEPEVPIAKKSYQPFKSLMVLSSVAVGLSLSSCVDPNYNAYGHNSHHSGYSSGYSPGYRITSLPRGYRTENISGRTYYYHDGHYYQPNSGGYAVVTAPRSSRYYTEYSRYRQPSTTTYRTREGSYNGRTDQRYDRDSRYDDRDSRYGGAQIVTRLPSGYREVNHRGVTYYQSGDRYYSRQGNGYVIVQRPY
ncbi:MAG: DUF6515 family protein [Verrucomicrobiota bacterium]